MDKTSFDYWNGTLDEIFLDTMKMVHRGKDIDQAVKESYAHLISDPLRLANANPSDFKRIVNSWLSNKRPEGKRETPGFRKLVNLDNL